MNNLNFFHWLLVICPLALILFLAFYAKQYVKGVTEFLSAGRLAGRYVLCVAGMMDTLSVVVLIGGCESVYQTGFAMRYWNNLVLPVSVALGLCGWVNYRFRECRAMSGGQFLEMRYSRSFRIVATCVRCFAEMLTNSIGPGVAARFLIYLLGAPHKYVFFGCEIQTYWICLGFCTALSLIVVLAGGRTSLIVTDCLQGILSYPVCLVLCVFIFTEFTWSHDMAPVMANHIAGESFVSPYDVQNIRDFNMFGLVCLIIGQFFMGAWIGNDATTCGKTPHEQKMGGLLGTWRAGFSQILITLFCFIVIAVMCHPRFASKAHEIRQDLCSHIADSEEIIDDVEVQNLVKERIKSIGEIRHEDNGEKGYDLTKGNLYGSTAPTVYTYHNEGVVTTTTIEHPIDASGKPLNDVVSTTRENATYDNAMEGVVTISGPITRNCDDDKPYFDVVHAALKDGYKNVDNGEGKANAQLQKFKTTYNQQLLPVLTRKFFPPWLLALFIYLVLSLMITTDDTRLFNSANTLVQDLILPFFKKPPTPKFHMLMLRLSSIFVGLVFFFGSVLLSQMDYLNLFVTVAVSIWTAGAGAIVTFGLYSSYGTTWGAYASLFMAGSVSVSGMLCQRNWASVIVPWLHNHGWYDAVGHFLETVSAPLNPLVVWKMSEVKFPINSYEISLTATIVGVSTYWIFSFLEHKIKKTPRFNLDRLLHRGKYSDDPNKQIYEKFTWKKLLNYFVSITPEYTRGDKVLAWSIFSYSIIYNFFLVFVAVWILNLFHKWTLGTWSTYLLVTQLIVPTIVAVVSCVWFFWGGVRDLCRLFRDLEQKKQDDLDNGMVEGNVSLSDKKKFEELGLDK